MNASRLTKLLFMSMALLLILWTALPVFAQDPVASVSTGSLNVRTGPGMQYGSIATLPFGFGVQMVGRNRAGNWILIRLTNGVEGWVNLSFLFTQYPTRSLPLADSNIITAPAVIPFGTINAIGYQLRVGASLGDAVAASVSNGERVTLLGRNYNGTWAKVRKANGQEGWIEAAAIIGSVPVRSLAPADGSVFVPGAPSATGVATVTAAYILRAGPGQNTQAVALLSPGERVTLLGRNYDASWVEVRRADGLAGWVSVAGLTSATRFSILDQTDGVGPLPPQPPTTPPTGATLYTVQRGDTLFIIAQRYGKTVGAIAAANGIYNIDLIYAGQQLIIPG